MGALKTLIISVVIFLCLIICSCSKDSNPSSEPEGSLTIHPATSVMISDIANFRDGRDLKVNFNSSSSNISGFKIFIVKSDNSASISVNSLKDNTNYVFLENSVLQASFPADFKDSDGDLITEGVNYQAFVITIPISSLGLSEVISNSSVAKQIAQITVVRTLTKIEGSGTGGMEVDDSGNIYMGDFGMDTNGGGSKVYKISQDGNVEVFSSGFNTASGNDFDSFGNLFQSSFDGKYISKIDPSGNSQQFITNDLIKGPVGIAIDGDNNLFVADYRSGKILKITPNKEVTVFSSSGHLDGPNGLDFDSNGNLYVSNWNNSKIVKISPEGLAVVFANTNNNNAHLIINNDFIYAVGRPQHNISKINLSSGEVSFLINNGRGTKDGSLYEAQLSYPNDLAFSKDGNLLYINHVETGPSNGFTLTPTIIRVIDFAK